VSHYQRRLPRRDAPSSQGPGCRHA
jgi:hypothetical protein